MRNLHVVHLYNLSIPAGMQNPVKDFVKKVKPICLSTCMRQIFLFDESQRNGFVISPLFDQFEAFPVHAQQSTYEHLTGKKAYAFLLYWGLGGLHPSKTLNDDRLLGEIRSEITMYSTITNGPKVETYKKNKAVLDALSNDIKQLHNVLLTQRESFSITTLCTVFREACRLCAWTRNEGVLELLSQFDYTYFIKAPSLLALQLKSVLSKKIEKLNQLLNQKNEKNSFLSDPTQAQYNLQRLLAAAQRLDDMFPDLMCAAPDRPDDDFLGNTIFFQPS